MLVGDSLNRNIGQTRHAAEEWVTSRHVEEVYSHLLSQPEGEANLFVEDLIIVLEWIVRLS